VRGEIAVSELECRAGRAQAFTGPRCVWAPKAECIADEYADNR